MIILLIKNFPAKIKHLQNMKISSKFEGKSECPHYTQVKHYGCIHDLIFWPSAPSPQTGPNLWYTSLYNSVILLN